MENFHGRIEDEFYDLEDLPTLSTLLNKAYAYMLYFNLERVNLNLKRAPFEMVMVSQRSDHPVGEKEITSKTLTSWTFHLSCWTTYLSKHRIS